MATDVEIDRALAAIAETLNDQRAESFDAERIRSISGILTVDDGGGLHDESGARVGCVRKAPSGEWIVERQNTDAANAHAEVPAPAPGGDQE